MHRAKGKFLIEDKGFFIMPCIESWFSDNCDGWQMQKNINYITLKGFSIA